MKNQTKFMQKLVEINSCNNENNLINNFNIAKNEQIKIIIELVNQKKELNVDFNKNLLKSDNFNIQTWIKLNEGRTLTLCDIENKLKNAVNNYNELFTDEEDEQINLDNLCSEYDIFSLPTIENLEKSIENGNYIIVERISKNIDLSQNNNNFIYLAVKYNRYHIVKILIENGAIVDKRIIDLINSDWFSMLYEYKTKEEIDKMRNYLMIYYDK